LRGAGRGLAEDIEPRVDVDVRGNGLQFYYNEIMVTFGDSLAPGHGGVVDHHEGTGGALPGGPVCTLHSLFSDPEVGEHCLDHPICPTQGWS
jgi:hypothetical protein